MMSRSWMAWMASGALIGNLGCGASPTPQIGETASKPSRPAKTADVSVLEEVPADEAAGDNSAAEAAFDKLLNASQDSDPDEWTRSETALTELGAAAVPMLSRHLSDRNPFARELAVQFLAQLGPAAASAEPQLIQALSDDSSLVRMNAAAALLSMNSTAKEITPALESLLTDAEESIRLPAAISLSGLEPNASEAIAALTDLLSASNSAVRLGAVEALGRLGDKASSTASAVRRLTEDDNSEVRTAAAKALQRIESGEAESSETIPAGGVEE